MTSVVDERPPPTRPARDGARARSGAPARRAVVRWAWRMFRREWRRQALILALLSVAVAATTVGLALVSNAVQLGADPTFGTAGAILTFSGSDPSLAADLAAAQRQLGTIEVVTHQSVAVPGSVTPVDLRAESPNGAYLHVALRLDAGRYPSGADQVAVTADVAQLFGLHVGGDWDQGGQRWQVVGRVENPLNLLDQFALVAPGQANAPANVSIYANASPQAVRAFRLPSGTGMSITARASATKTAAEALVLVLATIGLLFVGLLAVAGFAVIAQRRLRSLGMLSSLGATDRQVRLVMLANGAAVGATSASVGAAAGLGAWLLFAPTMQSLVHHRIDRFNLPWWSVGAALILAFVTAVVAAWWPARAVSRIPIMAALSGRPPRPQPARRFAVAGALLLIAGLVLLSFSSQHQAAVIISGTVATVVGLLLMAPLSIQAIAKGAGRAPIAVRLALRDLARYQARSGAALGAATLAVAIAATIAISAAAAQVPSAVDNLPATEINLYFGAAGIGPGNPVPVVTTSQQQVIQPRVDQLARALNARTVLPIEAAINPASASLPPQPGPGGQSGQISASLARVGTFNGGESVNPVVELYVATPALLSHYGIALSQINPTAEIISGRSGLAGLQVFLPDVGLAGGAGQTTAGPTPSGVGGSKTDQPRPMPPAYVHPTIQTLAQLPLFTAEPTTVVTAYGMQLLGLQAIPAGWVIDVPTPLTSAQIATARKLAASLGLSVETKSAKKSTAALRNWSTAAGILLALGVLAMTVGLIRSETANDLRTLSASGASSTTRRAITGATAGALALLGALLGTAGAYAALVAWHRHDLHPLTRVPVVNLVVIVVALPLIATAAGWLLAGREPPAIARQPLE